MIKQGLVDGWRTRQHGDPLLLNDPHRLFRIESQLGEQCRAGLQASEDSGFVSEIVKERVDAQVTVGAGYLAACRPCRGGRQRLAVRTQHALASSGGAGGEQDVGDVVRAHPSRPGVHLCRRNLRPGHELVPVSVIGIETNPDDVPQCRQRTAVQFGDPVGAQELTHSDQ